MIKIKKANILYIIIMLIFINMPISLAKTEITIVTDKQNIQIEENLKLNINITDTNIASLTLEIYFNQTKLEYINGPENSNNSGDRILYTWVSETGENKQNINIGEFVFKAKENGVANIVVTGEFYNSEGNQIQLQDETTQIQIVDSNKESVQNELEEVEGSNLPDDTKLSSLRINQEGISPNFNADIKEYYFIANKEIDKLEVTAIPQNRNATVTITGNNNLKMGENIINIKVESEDKTKTAIYKIYVTRTENLDKANANLENFAVRQATLNPEFDSNITQYKIEIANDINKLDILAIPQKENATVKITGNDDLKIGKNKIEIIVLAEDGITSKKYVIEAYRRNEEEEVKYQEQEKLEAERLTAILEEKQNDNEKNVIEQNNEINENIEEKNYDTNNINIIVWAIIICLIIIGIILLFKIKKKGK